MLRRIARSEAAARAAQPLHTLLAEREPALRAVLTEAASELAAVRRCQQEYRARVAEALRREASQLALASLPIEALLERELARLEGTRLVRARVHPADLDRLTPAQRERLHGAA